MSFLSWLNCNENADKEKAWQQQNAEEQTNPVYKLLNNHTTGELIELYDEDSPGAIEDKFKDELAKEYLYHEGAATKNITHTEYSKWRQLMATGKNYKERMKQLNEEEFGTQSRESDKVDYSKDLAIQFDEHEGCWDLNKRGAMGETLLHLCYLNNTEKHLKIADVLLKLQPKLALDIYEAEEYYGESALHFAVVHNDLESVKKLIQNGANINQRATGRFFLPEDQKSVPRKKTTNYEGEAYYGEYPLAFAACLGYEAIYDYLLQQEGADPNLPDSFGNTVLHMLVIRNKPAMYSYVERHPHHKKADYEQKNYSLNDCTNKKTKGLTPLALANHLGRKDVFNEILELRKKELWRFSNVTCSIYPVTDVDTIGPKGDIDWDSSLMITLNRGSEDHVDMLQSGVLRQLLDDKWKYFVQKRFYQRVSVVLAHIIFMTIAVSLRPRSLQMLQNMPMLYARSAFEILTLITCLVGIGMQIQEIYRLGFRFSVTDLLNAPFKALYLLSCFLQLLLLPIRLASYFHPNTETVDHLEFAEETILAISLPITWTMVLFFAKVTILCGPLINLVFVYIRNDLLPFLMIVAVVFVAFALSFHNMYKTISNDDIETFDTFFGSLMALFQFTLGEFEYDEFKETSAPALTMIVFVFFMLMMPILLLNMLIAMMTSTFEKVIAKSEKDWIYQWAKIVIALESTFNKAELLEYQKKYVLETQQQKLKQEHSSAAGLAGVVGETRKQSGAARKKDTEKLPHSFTVNVPEEEAQRGVAGGTQKRDKEGGTATEGDTEKPPESTTANVPEEVRGVMVIKTTTKTKAKQKKDAQRNWKWTAKEVLHRIKEIKEQSPVKVDINFETVFSSGIDDWPDKEYLGRRKSSNRRGSVDLATAVEQLADSLAVRLPS